MPKAVSRWRTSRPVRHVYYPGESPRSLPAKGVYGSLIVEPADGQKLKDLTIDLSQSTASIEGQLPFGPEENRSPAQESR